MLQSWIRLEQVVVHGKSKTTYHGLIKKAIKSKLTTNIFKKKKLAFAVEPLKVMKMSNLDLKHLNQIKISAVNIKMLAKV